ncbi:hypothetical protein BDZ97DRAFT_1922603 [Flammula alnicola]|nr:hypothetical protein BDZ97DRAFT_1922603 [Flammula alnicola]
MSSVPVVAEGARWASGTDHKEFNRALVSTSSESLSPGSVGAESDTRHIFQERILVEGLQCRASEPVYCSVWNQDSDYTDSIKVTNENYRSAACKLEDGVRRAQHVNTPHVSSSSSAPCTRLYSSSARHRRSSRSARKLCAIIGMGRESPKYSDSSLSESSHTFASQEAYPPQQISNPQVAHYMWEAEVLPMGFPPAQAFLTLADEQSRWSNENKAQPIPLYSPPSLLPNNPLTEQSVPYYSHEFLIPRPLDLASYQDICSGGQSDLHYSTVSFMPEQTTTFSSASLIPTEYHPLPPPAYHNLFPDFDSQGGASFTNHTWQLYQD